MEATRWARNPWPFRLIHIAEPAAEDSTVPESTAYSGSGMEKGNFFVASVPPLFKKIFFRSKFGPSSANFAAQSQISFAS